MFCCQLRTENIDVKKRPNIYFSLFLKRKRQCGARHSREEKKKVFIISHDLRFGPVN